MKIYKEDQVKFKKEEERKRWRDSSFAEIADLYQILYTEFRGRHLNHEIAQLL